MKDCTVYKTMNIIGKRWTIHILLELHKGEKKEKRFNELKRKLGYIRITSYNVCYTKLLRPA